MPLLDTQTSSQQPPEKDMRHLRKRKIKDLHYFSGNCKMNNLALSRPGSIAQMQLCPFAFASNFIKLSLT